MAGRHYESVDTWPTEAEALKRAAEARRPKAFVRMYIPPYHKRDGTFVEGHYQRVEILPQHFRGTVR